MKLDPAKKMNIGTKRTLSQLIRSLSVLLTKKSFEEISVKEICEMSLIPKSTFYNYFEDKYDLLDYGMTSILNDIRQKIFSKRSDFNGVNDFIGFCYDAVSEYKPFIMKLLVKNPVESFTVRKYYSMIIDFSHEITLDIADYSETHVPIELMSRMNAYAFLTVFEWIFLENHPVDRDTAIEYINTLFQ